MKKCSCCKQEKPRDQFQVRKASKDGLTASCRECLKERDKERYEKEKDARSARHKAYMQTDAGRESHMRSIKEWQEKNKLKRAVHIILGNAVKKGSVQKTACFICGEQEVQAHHADYDAPLSVIWLCSKHHKQAHMEHEHYQRQEIQ